MKLMGVSQHNYPLYIGLFLVTIFVFLAVFGPLLAPHDPMEPNRVVRIDGEWNTAPHRPFTVKGFPLGSDEIGRDLLSRILWGVRPTLLMAFSVVMIRVIIGLGLGLVAGWRQGGILERSIDTLIGASVAVPMLVFAIAVTLILGVERGLITFIIALCLTGWADTAAFVKNRTLSILQAPFIEGARAIGVKPVRLLGRYILPQLWPVLPSLIAFELAAVMLLVAELGFLGIFIGGGFVYDIADPASAGTFSVVTSGIPELGQLLADFWAKIIRTPWIPLYVGIIIFVQIFAFNLLGEGLRRHMDVTRPRHAFWRNWFRKTAVKPALQTTTQNES